MKYICILLFLFSSLLAKAQQLAGFKPNESTRLVLSVSKPSKSKTSVVVKKNRRQVVVHTVDYVLYKNVDRRFSWLEGVGKPITQEEANHLPCYYKFFKKRTPKKAKNSKIEHWV